MSPHHPDQVSKRSGVTRIALWMCSLNLFVFFIVFFFLFVVFLSSPVSSSLWSNVSKVTSLWDPSLMKFSKCICLCLCISFCHCLFLVRSYLLITLIKCLKGHKSLGSLICCLFKKVTYSLSEWVTRSPIELSAGQLKIQDYFGKNLIFIRTAWASKAHTLTSKKHPSENPSPFFIGYWKNSVPHIFYIDTNIFVGVEQKFHQIFWKIP